MTRTVVPAAVAGHSSSPLLSHLALDHTLRRSSEGFSDNMTERELVDYGTMNHAKTRQQSFSSRTSGVASEDNGAFEVDGDENDDEEEEEEDRLTPGMSFQVPQSHSYSQSLVLDSYKRTIFLYSAVPITAFLAIFFFIVLHRYLWPSSTGSTTRGTYIMVAFLGASIWTVSFALRVPLYLLSTQLCRTIPSSIPFVSMFLQVLSEESLRLSSIILAQIHVRKHISTEDPAFSQVWTLALGWAAAEVVVSIAQGYAQLALYSDITTIDTEELQNEASPYVSTLEEQPLPPSPRLRRHPPETEADRVFFNAFDKLLRARARVELEALYGVSVPVRHSTHLLTVA